jgi:cellulose synthase/poly-beta-1,6-N-acetylglucosamine synthase-like glycosyltransferase
MKIVFWGSVGLIVYTYAVYPCILLALASFRQVLRDTRFAFRRGERRLRIPAELPTVSMVISAFNEEALIEEKLRNCAALNYPASHLEVLVGCDGCTDRTVLRAEAAGVPNARIINFSQRRGKPVVLNELITYCTGDIVVFSDANTMLAANAVSHLVRHFEAPAVGCVSGELTFIPTATGTRTEGVYWRYEVLLKFLESRLNMMVGANGGLYAIRRVLYSPIPNHGIIDDFLVSMAIRQKGYHLVYDPEATATEHAAGSVGDEFRRRVRIGAGNFYALRYTWRLLRPSAGLVSLAFWSHKVLRWLVPFALVSGFVGAVVLAGDPVYASMVVAALGLSLMATVGYYRERGNLRPGPCGIPYYFLSMNLALALGLIRFLRGSQSVVWKPTARHVADGPKDKAPAVASKDGVELKGAPV